MTRNKLHHKGAPTDWRASLKGSEARPKLAVSYLMVFVAASCMYLGAQHAFWATGIFGELSRSGLIIECLLAPSKGVALASLLLCIVWRHRGVHFPIYPGEWILVTTGVKIAVASAIVVLVSRWPSLPIYTEYFTFWIFLVPALCAKAPPLWRAFFWTAAATDIALLPCLGGKLFTNLESFIWLWAVDPVVPASIFLLAVLADARWPAPQPWSHWAGLTAYSWTTAVTLIWSIGYAFLWPPSYSFP